jgi:GNAT superfamily N-acetyltransferase
VYGDDAEPEDVLRHNDAHRDPRCRHARWVAEDAASGQVVGYGEHDQHWGRYHPRRFTLFLGVLTEHQGCGVGRALYEHVVQALAPFSLERLSASARENSPRAFRFFADRGFVQDRHVFESELDVPAFDLSPFADLEMRLRESENVVFRTLGELSGDPERNRKVFDLRGELRNDMPASDPATPEDFDFWVANRLHAPYHIDDAYFIAVHEPSGAYVGMSNLGRSPDDPPHLLFTGTTGVRRDWRGKKIALALKVRGIAYARAHGHTCLRTSNDSLNAPMLAINDRLGFVRRPGQFEMVKDL